MNFDDALNKITKSLGKGVGTAKGFRRLIRLFGDALHDFIEHNTTFKPDDKGKDKGKADKKNAQAAQDQLKKLYTQADSLTTTVGKQSLDSMAKDKQTNAAREKAHGDAAVAKGDDDQATEDYVNAAINEFRAALCFYAEGDLGNPKVDYTDQTTLDSAVNYATRLTDAAQDLADAAAKEDPEDAAEILAELMVSVNFFDAAKKAIEAMENGLKKKGKALGPPAQKVANDLKDKADTGKTNSQTQLDTHLKP